MTDAAHPSRQPWRWDETLYAGAGRYYVAGRMAYPTTLVAALRDRLGLDGTGRLLDVGCGPGALTLPLAPLVAEATGIDGSAGMLAAARTAARRAGIANVTWVQMRGEDVTAQELGRFRAVTFAQSFHWVDRPRVAHLVRGVLEPGGALVLVYATTHQGAEGDHPLPRPRPPRSEISALVARYLGNTRRAGRGTRTREGPVGDDEVRSADDVVLTGAGFAGPDRHIVSGGPVAERDEDEVVASVFSLSFAAPHLFAERKAAFERDLRGLLRQVAPDGRFCEEPRDICVDLWRPGP